VKTCPDCNGDGVIEKGTDDEQQCPTCGGSGFVPDDDDDEEITRTASAGARPRVSSDRYCLLFERPFAVLYSLRWRLQAWVDMGKRRPLFSAIVLGCAVLAATPSWAAVVEPGYGDLTINQGQGFRPVAAAVNANVGDSVMVDPGGSATIVYEDGCKVNVRPGAVTTIAPLSPCASGSNAADMGVPRAGVPPAGPAYQQDDTWGWIIGGTLFAIGIGIAAYEASKSNGTTTPVKPASP
jgi:hypothetical protein